MGKDNSQNAGKETHAGAAETLKGLVDQSGLLIRQQEDKTKMGCCDTYSEGMNSYNVLSHDGSKVIVEATEHTSAWKVLCCGRYRPFRIGIYDPGQGGKGTKKIDFVRNLACCGFAPIPGCAYSVSAKDAGGKEIAKVSQPCFGGCCFPDYRISDSTNLNPNLQEYRLIGPFCCVCDNCGCQICGCSDVQNNFKIEHFSDTTGWKKVGIIDKKKKRFDGSKEEASDNYKIDFPADMPANAKLGVLAALFHLDFLFFEDNRQMAQLKFCNIYLCGASIACLPLWMVCCCFKKNPDVIPGAPQNEGVEMTR